MQMFSASSLSPATVQEAVQRARRQTVRWPSNRLSDLIAGHHGVKAGALIDVKAGILILPG